MPIERFHAEITVPRFEIERVLRLAWREMQRDEGPISVGLIRAQGRKAVYKTLLPISEAYSWCLQWSGAEVKRVAKPRTLDIPPDPYLDKKPRRRGA